MYNKNMEINIKIKNSISLIYIKLNSIENYMEFNGKKINKNVNEFCAKILNITDGWENLTFNYYFFDADYYDIEFIYNKKIKHIGYNGCFPQNYEEFLNIVKDIVNCF